MKLSKVQQEVLDLMNDGWELANRTRMLNSYIWLQKGGSGNGGLSKKISISTLNSLIDKSLIEVSDVSGSLTKYKLK